MPLCQSEWPVGTVAYTNMHDAIDCGIDVPLAIGIDSFTGCPIFLSLSRREISTIKTPVYEIFRFPDNRRPGRFQPTSITISGGITIISISNKLNTCIG